MHPIDDAERARIAAYADAVIEVLSARYGLEPKDVVDAVAWVREHRAFSARLKVSSVISLIGLLASALLMAIWQGLLYAITKADK